MPDTVLVTEEFALVRDFAIIMAVAGAAVIVFRKLNQPPILGYLIAGVLVGPFTFPSPPVTDTESIRLLADLGLVLLLFAVGLEFGWRRIRQVGLGVLLIGTVEMLVMISVGYQLGKAMGWTGLESVFLGAALSISSSAILIKVLRDTGQLRSEVGRIVVGVLVVEDFVAVILLTLLSGIATTGGEVELSEVGPLVIKIGIFGLASLALGAIFVPRIIDFVSEFRSAESMLLTSLALCFSLALLGQSLGISAAAGAFLIGAVVGDTRESEQVTRIIAPIRDMFGALFFVSIGMLVDIFVIREYLVPALVITVVFMAGKMFGDTVGTFITGRTGRVALETGTRMPQIGEFSLAMMKVGVEHNAIGAFLYQVVAAVTAINTLVYPYVVGSSEWLYRTLVRISPPLLKRYVNNLSEGLQAFGSGLTFDSEFAHRVRGSAIVVLLNFMIVVVLVGVGTFAVEFAPQISNVTGLTEKVVGSAIGFATLALCIPSAVAIWIGIQDLAEVTTTHLIVRRRASGLWVQEALRSVIRDSLMIFLIILIGLWSIPFLSQLLSLGTLAIPAPFVILAALAYVAIRSLQRMHGYLVETFRRTFLGEIIEESGEAQSPQVEPLPAPASSQMPTEVFTRIPGALSGISEPDAQAQPGAAAPRRTVSMGEAEMIALASVNRDRAPYRRRLKTEDVVWRIKEVNESEGYFHITLTFRATDAPDSDLGEEELYVDQWGEVRIRQVTRWPRSTSRRLPFALLYAGTVVVVAVAVGGGVFLFAPGKSTPPAAGNIVGPPLNGTTHNTIFEPTPGPGLSIPGLSATSTPASTPTGDSAEDPSPTPTPTEEPISRPVPEPADNSTSRTIAAFAHLGAPDATLQAESVSITAPTATPTP